MEAEDPLRAVMKLDERILRFAMRDRHATELYRTKAIDLAAALVFDSRLPEQFRTKRYPQKEQRLATRARGT
jgi:hypothetical protein